MVPGWLACSASRMSANAARPRLVVIQLSGGNDGLNVVAPTRDPLYRTLRPGLGLDAGNAITLGAGLALNAAAPEMARLLDEGVLHFVQGVGYPNAHRSHFRSMDVWQSGSVDAAGQSTGWLGRYLDAECSGCAPYRALDMGSDVSPALRGERGYAFSLGNLPRVRDELEALERVRPRPRALGVPEDEYVRQVLQETRTSAAYLAATRLPTREVGSFPDSALGRQLQRVAQFVLGGADTDIFYASLGGFDTHARQRVRHDRLLAEYSAAVGAFVDVLRRARLLDETLVLTYSEFGRRAAENANGGTDHGKANLAWVIGGAVRPGRVAEFAPDLARLDDGDLAMRVDFRSVYATILRRWLGAAPAPIIGDYPVLDFV